MVGNVSNYSKLDILRCFLAIEKDISRKELKQKLELGEGSIRTILDTLKKKRLIDSTNQGHKHSTKGFEALSNLYPVLRMKRFDSDELYLGYKKSALLLKKAGHKKINYHHRDLAIKYNAKGALILKFDNGLKIPEYRTKDFEDLEKLFIYDHNDVLIVSFAENYKDAENSCLAIALEFNDHLKDLFKKF